MENGISYSDVAAMVKSGENNGMNWNSPMWLIWALLFGNGAFGGWGNRNAAGGIEVNDRLNSLQAQIAANQQTNTLGAGIAGNHEALNNLLGSVNMGFAGTAANINGASTANLMSQKDMQAAMQSCCCSTKEAILNQTNQLQSQVAQLANGVQTGFANLGFLTQQQTTDINAAATANTQRILDHLCNAETQALRDKLAQASQDAQTATLIAQLKTTA